MVVLACGLYLSAYVESDPTKMPATKAELGAVLFKDRILSGDRTISCASCHRPELAFADTATFSHGVEGNLTARNTPTIMYLGDNTVFFWDGRAGSLEKQASGPITNPHEMNLAVKEAVSRLGKDQWYSAAFRRLYGRQVDSASLVGCLADFERTLAYYDAPYDRFLAGNDTAMSPAAIRGFNLFFKKNSCGNSPCHKGVNFNSDSLVNIGVYTDQDRGVFDLTKRQEDIGKFKSPTLRNVAVTAPYMHNGKHRTLREVIEYYNDPKNFPLSGNTHPQVKEQREKPLTPDEIGDMEAFLLALTDYRYMDMAKKLNHLP
jgi:cytochrome c peroxidase